VGTDPARHGDLLLLFLAFRLVVRREVDSIAISDMLLVMLVADAAQSAMASEYRSLSEVLVLASTILDRNILLDWASYRSPAPRALLIPRKVLLVRNGVILRNNLRRQLLTVENCSEAART